MAEDSQLLNGPATPLYVLRGHAAPIHALNVFSRNLRLVSGDADGWVVMWDLVTKRPVAAWKAHAGAVLELKGFERGQGITEIYTHGRDHKLCVWKIRAEDEGFLGKSLPVDVASSGTQKTQAQPWLLHSLPVNALNFCAFSMTTVTSPDAEKSGDAAPKAAFFAVPNALDSGGIDIFHLPSERRLTTIASDPSVQTGMVMAVNLFFTSAGDLFVASAYEDGHVMVFAHKEPLTPAKFEPTSSKPWMWEKVYICRPHTQPVLSIDVAPTKDFFLSSSADSLIVKHPIPGTGTVDGVPVINYKEEAPLKVVNTKHSGQQGLQIRSDGKIFATAGWDSRVRVYSGKTMKELAVLKWHKDGCYCVAFGETTPAEPKADIHTEKSLVAVQNQRNQKIHQTHWLAAGSKDGKISLWDIY
ncbi:hypothetical protein N7468_001326 [Penicillium chermesinum]|uniref:ASTRA-associated protein 1 n=1 Tax=Penicillium chermesinum TaxID=63820 RepID=A0A9W9PIM6_9EURO|nr:uncharacterized protein N7468_001326 [Penicillium chermesinum]KAJ5246343.1 hypothetical protein N7468_001326 [Penicillium chermesinum]KAJ6144625.1 hypothetical protein N7470_008520 [Penicillium chermesinum]